MGTQQLSLKRSNFLTDMLNSLKYLLSNQSLVDVTLACEGHSLKVHKLILAAYSPFFQTLFSENPCMHPIVFMKNVKYADLKTIVDFMYRGEVSVPQHQLESVVKTAQELHVQGLEEVRSDEREMITEENVVEVEMTNPSDHFSIEHVCSVNVSPSKDGKGMEENTECQNLRREKQTESELVLSEFPAFIEEVKTEIESSDDEYETNDADDYIQPQVSSVYSEYHDASMEESDSIYPSSSLQNVSANTDELAPCNNHVYDVDQIAKTTTENIIKLQDFDSSAQKIITRSASRTKRTDEKDYDENLVPCTSTTPEYVNSLFSAGAGAGAKDVKSFALISHEEQPSFAVSNPSNEENCSRADQSDTSELAVPIIPATNDYLSDNLVNEDEVQETICVEPDIYIPSGDESGFSHSNASYQSLYHEADQNDLPNEELVQEQGSVGQDLAQRASGYLESRSTFLEKNFYIKSGKKISVKTQSKPLSHWKTQIRHALPNQAGSTSMKKKQMLTSFSSDTYDKNFPYNFALSVHQRTPIPEKLFACNFCDMKYKRRELLQAHQQTHNVSSLHGKENLDDNIENFSFKKEPVVQLQRIEETPLKRNVCGICNKKCTTSYNLERHQMIHTGQKPFPCGICYKRFYRKDNLQVHRKTHHANSVINNGEKESIDEENITRNKGNEVKFAKKESQVAARIFNCNVCSKTYGTKSHLLRHKLSRAHQKRFNCNICNRKFLHENSLRVHQFTHNKDLVKKASKKVVAGKSNIFNKTFTSNERKTEDIDSQFSCNICIKKFQSNSQLIRHARLHSGERPFSCRICKRTFSRKDNLKTHEQVHRRQLYSQNKKKPGDTFAREMPDSSLNQVKTMVKLFLCRFCDKKFQSNSELIAHQKTHNSSEASNTVQIGHPKSYVCIKCGYNFPQRNLLDNHSKYCKGKELHSCHICSKSFPTTADLLCHLERHAGRLPFTCGLCGKSFAYKYKFTKHCKTHEKGKYICNKCGEEFMYAAQLLIHVKMHASKKRFPCAICHKRFGSVFHLNKHLDSHRIMSSDQTCEIAGDTYTDHTYAGGEMAELDQTEKGSGSDQSKTLRNECHSDQMQAAEKELLCNPENYTKIEMKEKQ